MPPSERRRGKEYDVMFDNLNLSDEAMTEVVKSADKHIGETYDNLINPPAKELGNGLAGLIKLAFAPVHALNSPEFKAKFSGFVSSLAKKREKIPPEQLCEPDNHVALLALQDCIPCITESELSEMFANLICSSMNTELKDRVHPSFPEMLKQMSPLDARVLQTFSKVGEWSQPIGEIEHKRSNDSYEAIQPYIYLPNVESNPSLNASCASVLQLSRLNLVTIEFGKYITAPDAYNEINGYLDFFASKTGFSHDELLMKKGIVALTQIGHDLLRVCMTDPMDFREIKDSSN